MANSRHIVIGLAIILFVAEGATAQRIRYRYQAPKSYTLPGYSYGYSPTYGLTSYSSPSYGIALETVTQSSLIDILKLTNLVSDRIQVGGVTLRARVDDPSEEISEAKSIIAELESKLGIIPSDGSETSEALDAKLESLADSQRELAERIDDKFEVTARLIESVNSRTESVQRSLSDNGEALNETFEIVKRLKLWANESGEIEALQKTLSDGQTEASEAPESGAGESNPHQ